MPALLALMHSLAPWACDQLPPSRILQRNTSMTDLLTEKMIPLYIVVTIVIVLYFEYLVHCVRILRTEAPKGSGGTSLAFRGLIELTVFHIVFFGFVYCFLKSVGTFPGTIPDNEEWTVHTEPAAIRSRLRETKRDGQIRYCKFCFKYKPDRAHHCRYCDVCILRMDHHCHFVMNCIGFYNYKYFFCLVVYSAIALGLIVWNMFDTTWWTTRKDVPICTMLLFVGGQTFASFALVLVCCFLVFHVWLMCNSLTTVELMEKRSNRSSTYSSLYSMGWYENICAVLGPRPLLWFLPMSLPTGNGLDWTSADLANK